jgi:hypothetical protein
MNVAIFWDIAPFIPYVNRHFGGTYHFHLQGRKRAEEGIRVWLVSRLIYYLGDGGDRFLRNGGLHTDFTVLYLRIEQQLELIFI